MQWSKSDPAYKDEMNAQQAIFESIQSTLRGMAEVLERRIEQLESKVIGQNALKKSKETLAASYSE